MTPRELVAALRESRGFQHKTDLANILPALPVLPGAAGLGDDCAVIADGDGHLLFAIEGFMADFVQTMPWFAGYCGVMVNVSDVYAMGGRPMAVVDALWTQAGEAASDLLRGLTDAARIYAVPIVGGHSNTRSPRPQLAVAVLGRAGPNLLSSFAARPRDELIMAIDLRGQYHDPFPFWDASTGAPAERLRADLELLPMLAELKLCDAAKDISMAGCLGTALMLLECSEVGARIDVEAIPRPAQVQDDATLLRWLTAFPSYGFLLSVRPAHADEVMRQFRARHIEVNRIGTVTDSPRLDIAMGGDAATLWDLARQPFMAVQGERQASMRRATGSQQ